MFSAELPLLAADNITFWVLGAISVPAPLTHHIDHNTVLAEQKSLLLLLPATPKIGYRIPDAAWADFHLVDDIHHPIPLALRAISFGGTSGSWGTRPDHGEGTLEILQLRGRGTVRAAFTAARAAFVHVRGLADCTMKR